ncbi:MAG: glutamate racemase [Gammaproteobacteria bacterium]|nr:glutamate racemase [Gammaproteobacteria bacterium]
MNDFPIGVFDSGVGGLSVLKHIRELLPQEHLYYVADSANAPYGNKSDIEIQIRSDLITRFLLGHNIKALVVACNTATAAAIEKLRSDFDLPIIGMEPAVKPAALMTQSGVVGILATPGTIASQKYAKLYQQYAANVTIISQPCVGLVEQVEMADLTGAQTRALIDKYVASLLKQNVDTLVLGCTHYPFLKSLIEEIAGEGVSVIDTGGAVAKELRRKLEQADLLNKGDNQGEVHFWSNSEKAHQVVDQLWDTKLTKNKLDI